MYKGLAVGSLEKESTTTPNEANSLLPTPYSHRMDLKCSVDVRWTSGGHLLNIQQMVMNQEIDKFPLKDLQSRYSIGRSALYERFKHANIKPNKEGTRSFVSGKQN
ncbi:MAG: hypothetical protein F6K56_24915 [Moorea sp. SIO3G5]|nr:hypothetical protein [Moorena sp. SIO3G5]